MILLLDTSTSLCKLKLVDGDNRQSEEWQADRSLAKGLLKYLHEHLKTLGKDWSDIKGIGVFRGPGSFTGLRIGLTVLNTIADAQSIPIVGATGGNWENEVVGRIDKGENDKIVLPLYGSEAHITKPRK
jgi:tRNA threonylcarbamoyladenosine biosynthesis protein TsaB